MKSTSQRLREIDFLRGTAIILVMFRHSNLTVFTTNLGWIGVDLFFVLSGFLVTGLLLKEFLKYGDIQPLRFLVRRGFKIYPIYYLFYIPYLIVLFYEDRFNLILFLSDMFFVQNYVNGWGYAYNASWSLAVEEHFYFSMAIILWIVTKYNKSLLKLSTVSKTIFIFLLSCFIIRIFSTLNSAEPYSRIFTLTHLRIDSLLAGTYVSFLFYFRRPWLAKKIYENKIYLISTSLLGLIWAPFIDPVHSIFIKTIGFTLLYISFAIILVYFLLTPNMNSYLDSLLSQPLVDFIGKVGYCSYSIYIIHSLVNHLFKLAVLNKYFDFFATSMVSILLGMIMTKYIEAYFLKIRNKYVPSRIV